MLYFSFLLSVCAAVLPHENQLLLAALWAGAVVSSLGGRGVSFLAC